MLKGYCYYYHSLTPFSPSPSGSLPREGGGRGRKGGGRGSLHHLLAIDDIQATAIHVAYLAAVDVIDGF